MLTLSVQLEQCRPLAQALVEEKLIWIMQNAKAQWEEKTKQMYESLWGFTWIQTNVHKCPGQRWQSVQRIGQRCGYAKKTRLYCQNCQALITVFVYYVSQHFMTLLFFPACTSRILSCLSLLWPSMTMSTKLISLDLLDDQVLGVERWDAAQIYPKPIYTLMDSWHQVFEVWGSSI